MWCPRSQRCFEEVGVSYVECSREDKYDRNRKAGMGLDSIEVTGNFASIKLNEVESSGACWNGLRSKWR